MTKSVMQMGLLVSIAALFGLDTRAHAEAVVFRLFHPKTQALEVFRAGPKGLTLRDVQLQITARGRRLVFACNSGIFEPGYTPTGLHRDALGEWSGLNTGKGKGNFYTKPNGVFYLSGNRAFILETAAFARKKPSTTLAIQSGPLLLSGGRITGGFSANNPSRKTRNAVGVRADGTVLFAWARQPVNLYEFAHWLRLQGCRDALYLDGQISRMHLDASQTAPDDETFAAVLALWE